MDAKRNKQNKINIKDWEIDANTAKRMMKHHSETGNDSSKIVDKNDEVLNEIKKTYPQGKLNWVDARYQDEEDEKRYSKLRNVSEKNGIRSKKGNVKGFKTQILMVTDNSMGEEEVRYYDLGTIKPPPFDDED